MKFEPRENRKPEAPLNGKQGAHSPPGHWMLKYEESIGGGGTPSGASSSIHTGGGKSVPSVCTDPSLLLLCTTLPAISRAGALKFLRPADRIRMLLEFGFQGGS